MRRKGLRMKYLYINLDGAPDRRAFVEGNFAACSHREPAIERVSAIDIATVEANGVPGNNRPGEKACYLSHLKALRRSLDHDENVLIAEDDVLFAPGSTPTIEGVPPAFEGQDWDLVFTDICVPRPRAMVHVFGLVKQARLKGELYYLPLKGDFFFAGATSYIVNRHSKRKLLDLMEQQPLDRPYDLGVRDQIATGKLTAYVILPFATSLSKHGDSSQIQADSFAPTEFAWNSFRRLMWQGRDLPALLTDARKIDADFHDDEAEVFSTILKAGLSDGFGQK